jgi:hypothetical protein
LQSAFLTIAVFLTPSSKRCSARNSAKIILV